MAMGGRFSGGSGKVQHLHSLVISNMKLDGGCYFVVSSALCYFISVFLVCVYIEVIASTMVVFHTFSNRI